MNDSDGHKVTCGITPQLGQHLGICVLLAVATPTGDPPLVESPGIAVVKTNTTATRVYNLYLDLQCMLRVYGVGGKLLKAVQSF